MWPIIATSYQPRVLSRSRSSWSTGRQNSVYSLVPYFGAVSLPSLPVFGSRVVTSGGSASFR